MLSKENIDKLCMTGLYKCEPVLEWISIYKRNTPYWCKNWTFIVNYSDGKYFMIDTYFNDFIIELNDENFDKFEFVFDRNEVCEYNLNNFYDYDRKDRWKIPVDSGGISYPKCFIRKGAYPNKKNVIERIENEISSLENKLSSLKKTLAKVYLDDIDLRYV